MGPDIRFLTKIESIHMLSGHVGCLGDLDILISYQLERLGVKKVATTCTEYSIIVRFTLI